MRILNYVLDYGLWERKIDDGDDDGGIGMRY